MITTKRIPLHSPFEVHTFHNNITIQPNFKYKDQVVTLRLLGKRRIQVDNVKLYCFRRQLRTSQGSLLCLRNSMRNACRSANSKIAFLYSAERQLRPSMEVETANLTPTDVNLDMGYLHLDTDVRENLKATRYADISFTKKK